MVVNSIVDSGSSLEFSVYPNPASDQLKIDTKITEAVSIEIRSLDGKAILREDLTLSQNTLDVGNFDSGVYIILFTNQKGVLLNRSAFIKK